MQIFLEEQFTRKMLIREVVAKGNFFFIAYDGDLPVGYIRIRENNNPPELEGVQTIEIARIYTVKEYIGKGVGKLLMQTALDLGHELSKEVAWLGVWDQNQRAIDFYTSWGFRKFAYHDFILGEEVQKDWLMKKELD